MPKGEYLAFNLCLCYRLPRIRVGLCDLYMNTWSRLSQTWIICVLSCFVIDKAKWSSFGLFNEILLFSSIILVVLGLRVNMHGVDFVTLRFPYTH